MNSTTRIVTYDENTGGQTTQPTNVNGNWRINGSLTFSTPLSNKKFTVNTHTNTNYGNSVGFTVLNKESDAVKSNTTNLFLSERLKGSYRSDLIDFELSAESDIENQNILSKKRTDGKHLIIHSELKQT